jgi:ribosome biogenesis protein Nip4
MIVSKLSENESSIVTGTIKELTRSDKISAILHSYIMIKIPDKREDVYLIESSDEQSLKQIVSKEGNQTFSMKTGKIKLGFFIRQEFRISIESLRFIAQYCNDPVFVSSKQVERFIYGKDVNLGVKESTNYQNNTANDSLVLVVDKNRNPIGIAKIFHNQDGSYLKNIIDIGIYLRSEKTAF